MHQQPRTCEPPGPSNSVSRSFPRCFVSGWMSSGILRGMIGRVARTQTKAYAPDARSARPAEVAQEIARALGGGRVEDLRRRPLLDDAPGVEYGDPVADAPCERHL